MVVTGGVTVEEVVLVVLAVTALAAAAGGGPGELDLSLSTFIGVWGRSSFSEVFRTVVIVVAAVAIRGLASLTLAKTGSSTSTFIFFTSCSSITSSLVLRLGDCASSDRVAEDTPRSSG
uniref:Uncharacterized protein n=1 Tax=Panstrongylus lignarius TaxID=156445 RepID=A0A224Y1T9_9HEMI